MQVNGISLNFTQRGRSPIYHLYFKYQGRKVWWSTKKTNLKEAQEVAKGYIEKFLAGRDDLLALARHKGIETIQDHIDIYFKVADVKPETKQNNVNALKQICRECSLPLSSNVALLTKETVETWLLHRVEAEAGDKLRESTARRTANSLWNQAKSIWNRRVSDKYAVIPGAVHAIKLRARKNHYRLPLAELVNKTYQHFETFKDAPEDGRGVGSRDIYAAFILASQAGLRGGEIRFARPTWIENGCAIRVQTEKDFEPKNDERVVPLASDVCKWLKEYAGDRTHILRFRSERRGAIARLNAELKKLGWATNKKTHELRKFVGAQVAEQFGIYAASKYLGHAKLNTTVDHYADLNLKPAQLFRGDSEQVDNAFIASLKARTHIVQFSDGKYVTVTDAELERLEEIAAQRNCALPALFHATVIALPLQKAPSPAVEGAIIQNQN